MVCDAPPINPISISGIQKNALSDAKMMSALMIGAIPTPNAGPLTAAITGLFISITVLPTSRIRRMWRVRLPGVESTLERCLMSAPAEYLFPTRYNDGPDSVVLIKLVEHFKIFFGESQRPGVNGRTIHLNERDMILYRDFDKFVLHGNTF